MLQSSSTSESPPYCPHPRPQHREVTLKRSLKLWDLVIYGIVLIQPTAALPLFGVVSQERTAMW